MTITRLGIIRGSRRGIITDGDIIKREFVETHVLTSDDGSDDEGHVFAAMAADGYDIGDPWTGEGGSTNPGTYVVNVIISDNDATLRRWEVEVQYSSELPDGGSGGSEGNNPTNWEPKVRWETSMEERIARKDTSGQAVVLPNGEVPQYPPIYQMHPILTLTYSRWVDTYSSSLNLFYGGKTNSDNFLGYPPNTAFMQGISAESEFIYGAQRWWITYTIRFDLTGVGGPAGEHGWKGRTMLVGSYYLDNSERKPAQKFDKGPTVSLDGNGGFLDGDPDDRSWQLYLQVPFTPIV